MTPEEQVAHDAEVEKQLRDLATQIAQMTKLGYDPTTLRKAVVVAVNDFASPPTVSLNISGDANTVVSDVRSLNNYTPLVGQTVLLAKQGAEIFILGSIASVNPRSAQASSEEDNGWTKATLSSGSHGGNDNDVYYRRILDHGSWKMQWRGVWNPSGSTTMIGSGDALDPNYRPASYKAISLARNSDGAVTIRMDFNADGTVAYLTGTPTISPSTVSLGGTTNGPNVGHHHYAPGHTSADGYSDYDTPGHGHGWSDSASHSHGGFVVIGAPSWISLNGVEYFL